MAASRELSTAALHLGAALVEYEIGAKSKEDLGEEIGTLIALLEVYTDETFTEEEQGRIFQGSGHKVELLKAKLAEVKAQADADLTNAPPDINPNNKEPEV